MSEEPRFKIGDFVIVYDLMSRSLKRVLVLAYLNYGSYKVYDQSNEKVEVYTRQIVYASMKEYYEAQLEEERRKLSCAMHEYNKNTNYYKEKLKACGG